MLESNKEEEEEEVFNGQGVGVTSRRSLMNFFSLFFLSLINYSLFMLVITIDYLLFIVQGLFTTQSNV